MKFLRNMLDRYEGDFKKGGKLENFFPLYEMVDTFVFNPGEVAKGETHLRDAIDLKRLMGMVVVALIPCIVMAFYNTGFQANTILAAKGITSIEGWRGTFMSFLGLSFNPASMVSNMMYGALFFIPVYLVTVIAGGLCEVIFSLIRRHEINEGFLVTSVLFPLTLPPTVPLWQVAVGIIFAVVLGKEVFGGTGKNFLNIALLARAFLYFAYPADHSGDAVWIAVDGYTGATALGQAALGGVSSITFDFWDAFWGFIPGSMGETSTFCCLIGAFVLILTGIGSWRTMFSGLLSTLFFSYLFNLIGSETNPMFSMSPAWHLVLGGYSFGLVFMATDPVSSAHTLKGQYFYGALIGFMVTLIRVLNPAFPEGMMLAILFGNVFAPLIDWFVLERNIKRREQRNVI